ncbi:MAG: saccharopine dehydrogenase family protein [Candidatus Aminicenantales bacterium]
MRVLVLGCGEMGEEAIKDLYAFGRFKEIWVATRHASKAQSLLSSLLGRRVKKRAVELDVSHRDSLVGLMKASDVVVNCVGPNYKYEVLIAEAAIAARVHLVDINDDYETTFRMLDLDQKARNAGVLVVLGLGASPGINNIFARAAVDQLDRVEEVHTSWVMSGADPGVLALSCHLLHSLSGKALTYRDGAFVEVESFVDGEETVEFPEPVGPQKVFHVGHPEPITLSRCFPEARIVTDKATFIPASLNHLIRRLGSEAREKGEVDEAALRFHRTCKALRDVRKEGALRTAVKGKKGKRPTTIIYASSGRIAQGTGIAASIGAQMLIEGGVEGKGVRTPEACVDWRRFLKTIVSRRIGRLEIREV